MDIKKQKIVITRPADQAGEFIELLRALDAEPISFPMIKISASSDTTALDNALSQLQDYAWLILTSVNAVDAVWSRLQILMTNTLPITLRIAAVGPKTANALRKHGLIPDFVPDQYIGDAILPGLGCLCDSLVLLPSADLARDTLPDAISAADGIAHVIPVYETIPEMANPEGLAAMKKGVDLITFTSPSTVRNFIAVTKKANLNPYALPGKPLFAYIGPVTADAAEQLNLPVDILAQEHTVDGLIQAVLDHESSSSKNISSETIRL
ncbi:MAG: uroporphyrinogen-III synthase [Anaerolineae bacterium]|nr:uroporphyrinogen-III synthase [Anaerolineae bacterium]